MIGVHSKGVRCFYAKIRELDKQLILSNNLSNNERK